MVATFDIKNVIGNFAYKIIVGRWFFMMNKIVKPHFKILYIMASHSKWWWWWWWLMFYGHFCAHDKLNWPPHIKLANNNSYHIVGLKVILNLKVASIWTKIKCLRDITIRV